MVNIIGVRFRDSGKVYHFSAENMQVKAGQNVIVETARGVEFGYVVFGNRQISEEKAVSTLKPVIRIATEEDESRNLKNKEKSREAYRVCQEKIKKHNLEMKLIDCEYTFDNNKVLFYFTADGRIDFRELVKDLAGVFKTRIELRQIGVRDETKIKGGIGICGRSLCCHTFLSDFAPVSIKMAKEQNLSLNPTKISGMCGRLMCCLKNEQETYEYLNKKMPRIGEEITFRDGMKGVVNEVSVLRQRVKVIVTDEKGEKELLEIKVDEIGADNGIRRKKEKNINREKIGRSGKDNKNTKENADKKDIKEPVRETSENQDRKERTDRKQLPSLVDEDKDSGKEKSLIGADSLEENRRLYRMRVDFQNENNSDNMSSESLDDRKNRSGKNRNKSNRDSAGRNNRNAGQKRGTGRDDSQGDQENRGSKDSNNRERNPRRSRSKRNKNNGGEGKAALANGRESASREGSGASSRNPNQMKGSGKEGQSRASRAKDNSNKDKKSSAKHFRGRNYRGKKSNENSRNEERGETGRSSN